MKRSAFDSLLKPLAGNHPGQVSECFIARSRAMQAVCKTIGRVAALDVNVLILGENGVGKELVARAICQHSPRADRSFLKVNCAAIPNSLPASELFGHKQADGGTRDTHTAIINWGDGNVTNAAITQGAGSGTLAGSHVYAAGGFYTITVTLTDDDGGAVTTTTTSVVTGVGVVGDTLYIIGTDNDDHVSVNRAGSVYRVHADFLSTGSYRDVSTACFQKSSKSAKWPNRVSGSMWCNSTVKWQPGLSTSSTSGTTDRLARI